MKRIGALLVLLALVLSTSQDAFSFGFFGGGRRSPGGGGGGTGTVTSIDCLAGLTCVPDPITAGGTIANAALAEGYITKTASSLLTNEFALSSLATALLINTTTTGVPTAYGGTSCPAGEGIIALDAIGQATCALFSYKTIQEEGSSLTQRDTLNFIGASLTAADDAGNTRTNVTLSQSPVGSTSVVGIGRTLTAGFGMQTIGDLSADRTIAHEAAASGDQVYISDSTSDGTWRTLVECDESIGQVSKYTLATNTFSCVAVADTGSNVPTTRTITIAGTANQITSSAGAQDLSANRTWTLSLPTQVTLGTGLITGGQEALHLNPFNTGAGQTGELRFYELAAGGTNYRGFKSADALTGNLIWTLPTTDSTGIQCLSSNGSGILGWTACSGGSGSPGAPDTSIQFNDGGTFAGSSEWVIDPTTRQITHIPTLEGYGATFNTTYGGNDGDEVGGINAIGTLSSTGDALYLTGILGMAILTDDTDATFASGVSGHLEMDTTGTVSIGAALLARTNIINGGTVSANVGLYLEPQDELGALNYQIYSTGTIDSKFLGRVEALALKATPTAGDLASPTNGDVWYNSTSNKLRCRQNGSSVDCIAGGGTGITTLASQTGATQTITRNSPITGTDSGDDHSFGIQNAAADGSTKGAAAFTAADFDASSGVISIDYTNAQTASGSAKGFLASADFTAFNAKVSTTRAINTTSPISGGGNLSADRTIDCPTCVTSAAALTANAFVTGAGVQASQAVALTGIVKGNGASAPTAVTAPSGAIVGTTDTQTLTNKRITKRTDSTTSSATPTINTDNVDMYLLTAQAADITSFTTNLSGTPTEGQTLWIVITGTAARAITWGSSFEASTVALPTTTVTTARLDVGFVWNSVTSKWRCIAVA